MIQLKKPLVFFDLETTGVDIAKDRIVQIAIIKLFPDGHDERKDMMLNPTIPIPKATSDIHGFTDEIVKDKPTFKQISKSLFAFISDSDLAGFNLNNFDIPVLIEEFMRCGINNFPIPNTKSIDAGTIFKLKEPRTLTAALKFYCNKDIDDAHNAVADTKATHDVLLAQIQKYDDLKEMDVAKLAEFSSYGKSVGFTREFIYDENGEVLYNFGKQKGTKVADDPGLAEWMLSKDFSRNSKRVARDILQNIYSLQNHDDVENDDDDVENDDDEPPFN